MTSPAEKLAQSLEVLHHLQKKGIIAIQSKDLSRVHRERLLKNGFLIEVIKGWVIPTRPNETAGESTTWYASFWKFCSAYLNKRFGRNWCLSPEQSLLIHAGNWTVPKQLLVRAPKGNNKITPLPFHTSLLDARYSMPPLKYVEEKEGLRIFGMVPALVAASPKFFSQHPAEARAVLFTFKEASQILHYLLTGEHSAIAGRLAGAFQNIGKNDLAQEIVTTMRTAGFDIRINDPFNTEALILSSNQVQSPAVSRLHFMWDEMRKVVIEHFPKIKQRSKSIESYLKEIDETYITDAYHSLSIEGYRVTLALIDRVRKGNWNPDADKNDGDHKNALAARGYWQAFQAVKLSIRKVLRDANPGKVAQEDHRHWYRELFGPSVTSGILKPHHLAGYRNDAVYIRNSKHVPPSFTAVRDLLPVFFDHLCEEENPNVRIVLGHFVFVYIHPYIDGNGRMGRFLMNVMCAAAGYQWTVIPVEKRDVYMSALEEASVNQNIVPFCKFLGALINKKHKS